MQTCLPYNGEKTIWQKENLATLIFLLLHLHLQHLGFKVHKSYLLLSFILQPFGAQCVKLFTAISFCILRIALTAKVLFPTTVSLPHW